MRHFRKRNLAPKEEAFCTSVNISPLSLKLPPAAPPLHCDHSPSPVSPSPARSNLSNHQSNPVLCPILAGLQSYSTAGCFLSNCFGLSRSLLTPAVSLLSLSLSLSSFPPNSLFLSLSFFLIHWFFFHWSNTEQFLDNVCASLQFTVANIIVQKARPAQFRLTAEPWHCMSMYSMYTSEPNGWCIHNTDIRYWAKGM